MSFRDIELKPEYRSKTDDVIRDFYIPVLKQSVIYKRAVGWFSSSALLSLSAGICGLVENGGSIQMIASPRLSPEDIDAINDGIRRKDDVFKEVLLRELHDPKGKFEEARLNLLSNLIAAGRLEIRIAFLHDNNTVGMFHEKLGLMYDNEKNIIAFSGSMNESANAFVTNYESIDIFASWTQDEYRVTKKEAAFNAMWENVEPGIVVKAFPEINDEILRRYKVNDTIDTTIDDKFLKALPIDKKVKSDGPAIPSNIHMRQYQMDAVEEWVKQGYTGIFDMATGTGKTYTALAAISRLFADKNQNLFVIIICPFQHLVEQWKEDIIAFGMKPIVCYSASPQKNWRDRLNNSIIAYNLRVRKHFCVITTNATFSTEYVQKLVAKLSGHVVLVVDEAHNFGADKLRKTLLTNIPYRLALSATIDRYEDPEGTEILYDYFGKKCIEYSLKEAIDNDMLTPYYYYPVVVSLSEDELSDYVELTEQIKKCCHIGRDGKLNISDYAKMLLIKRARVVAGASEKIIKLKEIMENFKNDNQILVYCGATTMHDVDYLEGKPPIDEAKQIDIVTQLLGNELGMRVKRFTSVETAEEREQTKADFAEGKYLQALIAIRCLDEGVNIPSIRTAFILASSTNPKEYIQRRGRVLRKFPGKSHAVIYDFVTLPFPFEQVDKYEPYMIYSVQALANREIERIKDFAAIAENPFESDSLIDDIQRKFKITTPSGEDNIDV